MSSIVPFPRVSDGEELGRTEPTVGERQEIVDSIYRLQEELLAMRHHLLSTRSRLDTTKTKVARLLGRADF